MSEDDTVMPFLRTGGLIVHREQPVQEVLAVEKHRLLAARPPKPALRFLKVQDVAPPF